MRRLTFALLLAQAFAAPAFALSGATLDGEDRFPFVVEINLNHQLICSGTVLFPRIVVTSAHCVQDKIEWRGGQVFVDHYVPAADLSVTVTHRGKTETHDVADVTVSPDWRSFVAEPGAGQRFAYDIALIITKAIWNLSLCRLP